MDLTALSFICGTRTVTSVPLWGPLFGPRAFPTIAEFRLHGGRMMISFISIIIKKPAPVA